MWSILISSIVNVEYYDPFYCNMEYYDQFYCNVDYDQFYCNAHYDRFYVNMDSAVNSTICLWVQVYTGTLVHEYLNKWLERRR